jgi:hypothetical protein
MVFQITEAYGILKVFVVFNFETAGLIRDYVNTLLETKERVLVSLESVLSIDKLAAKSVEKLYANMVKNNKVISIFRRQNFNITEVMKATNTIYIVGLNRDYRP